MRPELGSVRCKVPEDNLPVAYVKDARLRETVSLIAAVLRAHLCQFPVQMYDARAPRRLVEIVHVLCDHCHVVVLLQGCNLQMGRIRLDRPELFPALVVEIQHERLVAIPAVNRRNILDIVVLPETVAVPECANAAFGAHSSAGENDYPPFHIFLKY